MEWVIYKHTNKVNGKVYIGQTCQKPEYRWGQFGQKYSKDNLKFFHAIQKYGWFNFEHEIIEKNIKSQELADEREIFWISYYDSYYNGYNMTKGGRDGEYLGEPIYQIDINLLKIIKEFNSTQDAARALKKEHGSSISACCLGHQISAFGFYWCKKSNYYIGWEPRNNKSNKPIFQIDKNTLKVIKEYPSISTASRQFNNTKSIAACCRKDQSEAVGYYWCYADEFDDDWKPKKNFHLKQVVKLNKNLQVVDNYISIADAARINNIVATTILMCCKRKYITAGGFYWCYADDYTKDWQPIEKKETHTCGKIVCQIDKKTLICVNKFKSVNDASKKLSLSKDSIGRCCRREIIQTGGYYWCYEKDLDSFQPVVMLDPRLKYTDEVRKKMGEKKKIPVVRYDNNGEIIKYAGVIDASTATGIDPSSIIRCCKGVVKTAGGYHWQYLDNKKD